MSFAHRARVTACAVLLSVLSVVMVLALWTALLFLWPPTSSPSRADAVVVLAGDHGERLSKALKLMSKGVAPTLVLAGNPDSVAARDLCTSHESFEVVCLRLAPDGTRYEARATGRLATTRRWRRIVVVTTIFHVSRSRVLFDRCVDGDVELVGAQPPYGFRSKVDAVVHEWLGLGYAETLARQC